MNAILQKNSVNDGTIQWVFFVGIFTFTKVSCVDNPSAGCKVVETLYL